jgi:hypothetical protein
MKQKARVLSLIGVLPSLSAWREQTERLDLHSWATPDYCNPWPAVPDWTLMPECRCRTEAADYGSIADAGLTFSGLPAFTYDLSMLYSKNNTISSCRGVQGVSLSTTCSLDVHWVSLLASTTTAFLNAGMSDCPASSQSGTGINKNSDAWTSPVPE